MSNNYRQKFEEGQAQQDVLRSNKKLGRWYAVCTTIIRPQGRPALQLSKDAAPRKYRRHLISPTTNTRPKTRNAMNSIERARRQEIMRTLCTSDTCRKSSQHVEDSNSQVWFTDFDGPSKERREFTAVVLYCFVWGAREVTRKVCSPELNCTIRRK